MDDLDAELERARALDVTELAEAIASIGFSCTRCGACCRADGDDEHTATVFPDEVRRLQASLERDAERPYDWRDVARPMPFGLEAGPAAEGSSDERSARSGETFEWALQTDACGDCTFYDDGSPGADGTCTVHADRPLICQTYPFSVELGGSEPMGAVVDRVGVVRAHECEGLGRDIERGDALALARTLKERAVREVAELAAVVEAYEPADPGPGDVVVHDSEGAKRPDGSPWP